jgi:DNA-binding CsgD family transcriptional regulator
MNESIRLLRSHFGLTQAEARLALHLVTGETLRSAALKLSITYETARTCLKNIFRKTGTCRQAELDLLPSLADPAQARQRHRLSKNWGIADDAHTSFGGCANRYRRFRELLETIERLAHEDGSLMAHEALKLISNAETLTLSWLDKKREEFPWRS